MYEEPKSIWNKFRGTAVHALFENEPDLPEWIIQERRAAIDLDLGEEDGIIRVSGQIDEIDTKYKIITDYKSAHLLKKPENDNYVAQLNMYRYMCKHGYWMDTGEKIDIEIDTIANHFVTWNTKEGKQYQKRAYALWDDKDTREIMEERVKPLTKYQQYGILPSCNPFTPARYWACNCETWLEQLQERGVEGLEKWHEW